MSDENAITAPQKEYLLGLMKRHEFDLRTCTLFHTRLAEDARIDSPRPTPGTPVDTWLQTVTKAGAGRMITLLKERL